MSSITDATAGRVRYRPQGEQLRAFGLSTGFVQIIRGPLGSGKTKAVVFKIIKLLCEQKPDANGVRKSRVAAIRNTYPDLQTTTIREFKECVSPAMGQLKNGHPPTFVFDFLLPDGTRVEAEVDFLALDRADDVKKLRGTQYTFAWLNETKELPKAILDMTTGRIDRYPTPGFSSWVGVLGDTNAWDEDHWLEDLYAAFLQNKLPGYEFLIQPGGVIKAGPHEEGAAESQNGTWWKVNPDAENISVLLPTYYARQISGKKDDWIKVNLANETGLALDGRAVHPEYLQSVHRANKPLRVLSGVTVHVGLDFGLTPAAVFSQKIPSGRWHVLREIVFDDGDATQLATAIKVVVAELRTLVGISEVNQKRLTEQAMNEVLPFYFRGDPSGDERSAGDANSTVFKVLAANGVVAQKASTNDPAMRREAVTRPLTRMVDGGPGILVDPSCRVLNKALAGGFCYRRVKVAGDERYTDKPDKNRFSHVAEALEYGLMDAGEHAFINAGGAKSRMPTDGRAVTPHLPGQPPGMTWNPYNV